MSTPDRQITIIVRCRLRLMRADPIRRAGESMTSRRARTEPIFNVTATVLSMRVPFAV